MSLVQVTEERLAEKAEVLGRREPIIEEMCHECGGRVIYFDNYAVCENSECDRYMIPFWE